MRLMNKTLLRSATAHLTMRLNCTDLDLDDVMRCMNKTLLQTGS